MKAEITFRSGAKVLIDVEDFTTSKSRVDGEFTKFEWTTPAEWSRKLHTLNLSQIDCVVVVEEAGA